MKLLILYYGFMQLRLVFVLPLVQLLTTTVKWIKFGVSFQRPTHGSLLINQVSKLELF